MTFFDFYSKHFIPLTVMIGIIAVGLIALVVMAIMGLLKSKKVKTPWFEIAPESVKVPESEEMGKTRLLISRQLDYVENYIDGLQPTVLMAEKNLINDAINTMYKFSTMPTKERPRIHLVTRLVQTATNELCQNLINYLIHLLIVNHIGTDKDKIKKYAKGHVNQIIGIVKKSLNETYCDIAGQVCLDSTKYWKSAGIDDPTEYVFTRLSDLLINISYLRYSDFDSSNDGDNNNGDNGKDEE